MWASVWVSVPAGQTLLWILVLQDWKVESKARKDTDYPFPVIPSPQPGNPDLPRGFNGVAQILHTSACSYSSTNIAKAMLSDS